MPRSRDETACVVARRTGRPSCEDESEGCSLRSPASRRTYDLFIEHDMDVVFRFASRIMFIGGVSSEGTPAKFGQPKVARSICGAPMPSVAVLQTCAGLRRLGLAR